MRLAVRCDGNVSDIGQTVNYEVLARTLGIQLLLLDARGPQDLDRAFEAATSEQVNGLYVPTQPVLARNRATLLRSRLRTNCQRCMAREHSWTTAGWWPTSIGSPTSIGGRPTS